MNDMNERKEKILAAIIHDFVATAEPVGSRTIARRYRLGISPATIRNEMADLEELGFIEQPHTSAGRIPSDKGYRYYVDSLMEDYTISLQEYNNVLKLFELKVGQLEALLETTGQILSQMTSYMALILGPQISKTVLRQIRLFPLEEGNALLVLVAVGGLIEHRTIKLPEGVTSQDLEAISNTLSAKLYGMPLNQLSFTALQEIKNELGGLRSRALEVVMEAIHEYLSNEVVAHVHLVGTLNILDQPEFKNLDKFRNLLALLEREKVIRELLGESTMSGLSITIGGENKYEEISDCSLVVVNCQINNQTLGSVGILGPTRMNYSRAVSMAEMVARGMTFTLEKLFR